jgi:ABC-type transport system involved in cytochrome c biogenesis ATPase subunit/GNAT superfamily N-acetyltransferase
MKLRVQNVCSDFNSYRAARVKSLFNAETGANFNLTADLDIDDDNWQIGVVVGPSGSGKTSIGRRIFGGPEAFYAPEWPGDRPIVDAIAPSGDFDAVTAALAAVGLGNVPSWLRPFQVLSMGEQFRATLARLVCEAPQRAVVDEFTSVVDRQIARFGALAFQKAWRRVKGSKVVLLTPHYDVLEWLEPDWVFDTSADGGFRRGRGLWRRPKFDLEIVKTDWRYWPEFEPHHYLKMPKMAAAICYVGSVNGERVVHMGMGSTFTGAGVEARGCRLVVKPEWQGAGVGLRFLNAVCQAQLDGASGARLEGRRLKTLFHTSHPGLCAALRRDQNWRQVSASLFGTNKARSAQGMKKSGKSSLVGSGYGGHFRAVQGFRYVGSEKAAA